MGRFRHAFSRGAVTHRLERKAPSSQLPPAYTQAHHALDEALTQLFLHHEEVTHYRGKAIEYTSRDVGRIIKAIVAWLEGCRSEWFDDESEFTWNHQITGAPWDRFDDDHGDGPGGGVGGSSNGAGASGQPLGGSRSRSPERGSGGGSRGGGGGYRSESRQRGAALGGNSSSRVPVARGATPAGAERPAWAGPRSWAPSLSPTSMHGEPVAFLRVGAQRRSRDVTGGRKGGRSRDGSIWRPGAIVRGVADGRKGGHAFALCAVRGRS